MISSFMSPAPTIAPDTSLYGEYALSGLELAGVATRNLTLHLNPDRTAKLEIEFKGVGTLVELGIWHNSASTVYVNWVELEGEPINLNMIFKWTGQALVLVGPEPAIFGRGVALQRTGTTS